MMTSNATTRFSQKLVILTFCITNEIIIITILHSALLFCLLLLKLYCYIIDRGNILEHSRFFFYLSPTSQRAALLLFPCITNENVFPGFSTVFLFIWDSSFLISLSLRMVHFISCISDFRPMVLLFQSKISYKSFYTNKSQNANPANWDKLKGIEAL